MNEYFLVINSKDKIYGSNDDFTIRIAKPLKLVGKWGFCLEEFYYEGAERLPPYFVCCSICEEGIIPRLPFLRFINGKTQKELTSCQLIPLNTDVLETIRFFLVFNGEYRMTANVIAVLHFKKLS
jgi:hypothetical protein